MNICQCCVMLRVPMGWASKNTRRSSRDAAAAGLCGDAPVVEGRTKDKVRGKWELATGRKGKAENNANIYSPNHTASHFPLCSTGSSGDSWVMWTATVVPHGNRLSVGSVCFVVFVGSLTARVRSSDL